MLEKITARQFHALIAFMAFSLLSVGFYFEYQMGLEPCPLCMLQRIVFFCVGVISLISALIKGRTVRKVSAWTIVTLSMIGVALAIRHLYLQHLPEEKLPACLPGLSYMFDVFPWQDIAQAMIMGTGECGEVVWTFLGLSIPGWTLVAFSVMAISNFLIALKMGRKRTLL